MKRLNDLKCFGFCCVASLFLMIAGCQKEVLEPAVSEVATSGQYKFHKVITLSDGGSVATMEVASSDSAAVADFEQSVRLVALDEANVGEAAVPQAETVLEVRPASEPDAMTIEIVISFLKGQLEPNKRGFQLVVRQMAPSGKIGTNGNFHYSHTFLSDPTYHYFKITPHNGCLSAYYDRSPYQSGPWTASAHGGVSGYYLCNKTDEFQTTNSLWYRIRVVANSAPNSYYSLICY